MIPRCIAEQCIYVKFATLKKKPSTWRGKKRKKTALAFVSPISEELYIHKSFS
jgi:hypothetical protein